MSLRLLIFLFCCSFSAISAQEAMEVRRCANIDRRVPIRNIYIDAAKNKWVADDQGLFLAQSPDFASTVDTDPNEWSLLSVPDGNEELNLPTSTLKQLMGDNFSTISTAQLDKIKQELWIGTENAGLYHFSLKPALQLIKVLNTDNSKLRSNKIQTIYNSPRGQIWVGTDDGLLLIDKKRIELIGKFFNIEAVKFQDGIVWVVGDKEVLEMDVRGRFYTFEADPGMIEGEVVDIAFDSRGRLWIASEVVVRYDFDREKFDYFGPAEGFTSQNVKCIAVDSDDALWVGTNFKGVYFIGKASTMAATVLVENPLGCDADAQNASLRVRASGGQPPYTYQWVAGLNGENPQNLGPGTYTVTVTDQNGKSVQAETIIEDPRLTLNMTAQKEAGSGGGTDGQAEVKVSGGNPPYKYLWDNGEKAKVATRLTGGQHTVTISDRNGCSSIATVEITEKLAPLKLVIEQTQTNNCYGDANAAIKAKATGGQGPYQYLWSIEGVSNEAATNLPPGMYKITATDAEGNTATAEISIPELPTLTASITPRSPASTSNADGKAAVMASGGSGKFSYRWDNGETEATAIKLAAGTHTVTITDEKGCTTTATIDIGEDILPLNVALNPAAEINCNGETTAALEAQISGGKAPFQYQWSVENNSGVKAANLSAGEYQLTVTDATGNTANASISIIEPSAISASISPRSPASTNNADGKATVKASGGSGKYSFLWDNGETEATAIKLAAGTHIVTITDEKGCTTTATIDISEDILPLSVALNPAAEINCNGETTGALEAQISGGKAPFQYLWSAENGSGEKAGNLAAGEYQLTVTDAAGNTANASISIIEPSSISPTITPRSPASTNNADGKATAKGSGGSGKYSFLWDNGETEATASKLAAGTHTVTVTDEKGCTATTTIDIGEDILPLGVALNPTAEINCNGETTGALEAQISGGKAPFQYQWSTGNTGGETASGLSAGSYQVTITDAAGTTQTASITISEPAALTLDIQLDAPASTDNADGKATVKASGGAGNYTIRWDNGETTGTASKLTPGKHSVTVTDDNGCVANTAIDINEDILPLKVELQQKASINCYGEQTATLEANVTGGKGPFQYQWNPATLNGQKASNISAGMYFLTITDASGQSHKTQLAVSEPAELSIAISKNKPTTNENSKDGKVSLTVEGGTQKYSYQWDNGETTPEAEKLAFGAHGVTVTDANGCSASLNFDTKKKIMPALTSGQITAGQTLQVSQLYFQADSTNMTAESHPSLNEIAEFLEENPLVVIEVGGHTNNIPPHEFCDQLSTARAKSVADYIVDRGIDPNRVVFKGYGKRQPKYSNRYEDGRRKNQRVEIKILRLK